MTREIVQQRRRRLVAIVREPPPHERELAPVGSRAFCAPICAAYSDSSRSSRASESSSSARHADERRGATRARPRARARARGSARARASRARAARLVDRLDADRRIAVHVAADPRSEAKRRRRVGQAAAPLVEQRLGRLEEAVLEEPEAVADLVGDPQPVVTHLVRLPEQRDLLGEPLPRRRAARPASAAGRRADRARPRCARARAGRFAGSPRSGAR